MLTLVPSGYEVRGIGLFNRTDERADVLLENVSDPQYPGLLRIDYAYSDMGSFGTIHRISVDLSPLTRKRYTQPREGKEP